MKWPGKLITRPFHSYFYSCYSYQGLVCDSKSLFLCGNCIIQRRILQQPNVYNDEPPLISKLTREPPGICRVGTTLGQFRRAFPVTRELIPLLARLTLTSDFCSGARHGARCVNKCVVIQSNDVSGFRNKIGHCNIGVCHVICLLIGR